jgi:hypothetical protein
MSALCDQSRRLASFLVLVLNEHAASCSIIAIRPRVAPQSSPLNVPKHGQTRPIPFQISPAPRFASPNHHNQASLAARKSP